MKVAIAGYGVEGKSNYAYFSNHNHEVTILDEQEIPAHDLPHGATTIIGKNAFDTVGQFDLVVRSPSISPHRLKKAKKLTSATQLFFEACPAPIIGVTGTKGKGTTASLIDSILRAAGKTSWLVGNIGKPSLDILDQITTSDVVVYELSSFQLWDVTASPHVAVVLMIEPDHLDVHESFAEYVNAKANITIHQTIDDVLVFNNQNDTATQIAIQSIAYKVPYQDSSFSHVKNGYFYYNEQNICSISSLSIPGKHNIDNACAAISAVWLYVQDSDDIRQGLENFTGLDHRLKYVDQIDGVTYYDDSIATTAGSAIAAIRAFDEPKTIIIGGSDKGLDLSRLYEEIIEKNVHHVITIGVLSSTIASTLRTLGYQRISELGMTDMETVVKTASQITEAGGVVVMSPACASFDMFKNYADRGQQFVAAVHDLKHRSF